MGFRQSWLVDHAAKCVVIAWTVAEIWSDKVWQESDKTTHIRDMSTMDEQKACGW